MLVILCPELYKWHSCTDATEAAVKVTDELQRDLMTLEYLSELKRKTESRRTETTNVSDKRAKDNN